MVWRLRKGRNDDNNSESGISKHGGRRSSRFRNQTWSSRTYGILHSDIETHADYMFGFRLWAISSHVHTRSFGIETGQRLRQQQRVDKHHKRPNETTSVRWRTFKAVIW